ncbi:TetR family transcriptional regulator [Actinomycetospora sp. OC33-EN08]|uniref:TetR family transcriptional regulator n=1 Tax=Actinomycetospora aurantiaca TaxID=3129233 RepID=A0ABU8MJ02_9PSEU
MPKIVDHARRRDEILEATGRLVAGRGLEGTTMRGIAAALGMANGALARYFPGKDEIVRAALEHLVATNERRIAEHLGDRRGLAAVRVLCELLLTDAGPRAELSFHDRARTDPDLAAALRTAREGRRARLVGFLAQARADGDLATDDPDEVLAEDLLTVVAGAHALATSPDLARRVLDRHLRALPAPQATVVRRDDGPEQEFLAVTEDAIRTAAERLPETDLPAMRLVLLLHRIANAVVYDLESTVHRPAGWSWSAFRLAFTLWVSGPLGSRQAARTTGMSRAAVSSLTNTLVGTGMLERSPDPRDGRGVVLSLTAEGSRALAETFRVHNRREAEWAGLLSPDDLGSLNRVLTRLAAAATAQSWVARR